MPALVPYDESGSESGLGESDTEAEAAAYAWQGAFDVHAHLQARNPDQAPIPKASREDQIKSDIACHEYELSWPCSVCTFVNAAHLALVCEMCRATRLSAEEATQQLRALQGAALLPEEDTLVPQCRLFIDGKRGRRYAAPADPIQESRPPCMVPLPPAGECGFKRGFLL